MSVFTVFTIIVCILIFSFLLENGLEILNGRYAPHTLPKKLEGIYTQKKYIKSLQYQKTNRNFSHISSGFMFVFALGFFLAGGFGWLNQILCQITAQPILLALLYFGIIGFVMTVINLPFSWYHTFVIEQKFGFNKSTQKTFWLDVLKSLIISAILGGGILSLVIWIYSLSPEWFWLAAWGAMAVISVFMNLFYSKLIVPLFNKQTPLPDGELRIAIENFSNRVGFKLENIFVIDSSKRSSKSNAYFTGFGKQKRIVLYDTLIDSHSTDELVAILAHEIGHYKKKHILRNLFISLAQSLLMFFLLGLFLSSNTIAEAMGAEQASFHVNIIAFGLLYSPFSLIFGLLGNILSRKYEYEADCFAAKNTDAKVMQDALKKLSVDNLSNLHPHPLYVFFHYSHPTTLQRLEQLDKFITT